VILNKKFKKEFNDDFAKRSNDINNINFNLLNKMTNKNDQKALVNFDQLSKKKQ